jgi:hypothetical protein
MTSVISPDVVKDLNLDIVDTVGITGINGASVAEVAVVSLVFPNKAIIKDLRVAVCALEPETEMIIGMDVIGQLDLVICSGSNQTLFSFAIPPFKNKIDLSNWQD